MKIVHSAISEIKLEKQPKHIPMYKDPVFMAELRRSFIEDHNNRLKAKRLKEETK